jgi:hypothetical protein
MVLFVLLAIPLSLLLGLAQAALIVWMWATFVVPTFGVPALTIPVAWGITLLVALARLRHSDLEIEFALNDDAGPDQKVKRLGFRMMVHLFALALCWLIAWVLTFFL